MAKRLLLTLLALLGLAAQLAPAQARVCASTASEVGGTLLAAREDGAIAARAGHSRPRAAPAALPLRAALPVASYAAPAPLPVLIGIDRARQ